MSDERFVTIKNSHPALAGHFPGNPVVPGVVILEEVLETIRQAETATIVLSGAPSIKFHSPLRPEEEMFIKLELYQSQSRKFSCRTGRGLIASGVFTYQKVKLGKECQK